MGLQLGDTAPDFVAQTTEGAITGGYVYAPGCDVRAEWAGR